jgi:hypothetical protein
MSLDQVIQVKMDLKISISNDIAEKFDQELIEKGAQLNRTWGKRYLEIRSWFMFIWS